MASRLVPSASATVVARWWEFWRDAQDELARRGPVRPFATLLAKGQVVVNRRAELPLDIGGGVGLESDDVPNPNHPAVQRLRVGVNSTWPTYPL